MGVISLGDILRGFLSFFLIAPTIVLSIYLSSALQSYILTGSDLWSLQKKSVPNVLIESLYEIQSEKYFFKYKLMNSVESKISNPELFKKYKQEIENQISIVPLPAIEYFFLGFLALIYGVFGYIFRKLFLKYELK